MGQYTQYRRTRRTGRFAVVGRAGCGPAGAKPKRVAVMRRIPATLAQPVNDSPGRRLVRNGIAAADEPRFLDHKFGFGILPLTFTTGAGAGAQNAIGTGVLGGMITATILVLVFVPLFYVLIEKIFGRKYGQKFTPPEDTTPSEVK